MQRRHCAIALQRRLLAIAMQRRHFAIAMPDRPSAIAIAMPDCPSAIAMPDCPSAIAPQRPLSLLQSWLPRLAAALASCIAAVAFAQPVEIFSPQGTVKGVRQASARFAAPMVPFGDPRAVDPFAIDCPGKGRGRWADPRHWLYDFDRDLPAGVRCTFTLQAGLTAADGSPLPAGQRFEFSTGGPAILRSLPYEGSRIDENQVFILGLDAPAIAASITANAYCVAVGIHERIGVRLVTGEERRVILDSRKSFAGSYLRAVLLDADTGRARAFTFALPVTGSDDDRFRRLRDAPDSPLVTLACARTLPAGAEVKLVWGKGITAASGIPAAADQALAFEVRPAFRASFSCERVNRNAHCLTLLPLRLAFTAPVARKDAALIRLVDAAGKAWAAKLPGAQEGGGIDAVSFGPGLPEKETFRLELPPDLKDDAGRPLANAATFPLKVQTDELPPLAKFPGDFGILESVLPGGAKPLLPVTVRNVEPSIAGAIGTLGTPGKAAPKTATAEAGDAAKTAPADTIPGQIARVRPGDEMRIVDWLRRIDGASRIEREYDEKKRQWITLRHGGAQSVFTASDARDTIAVPKPLGAKAFEVVGIPLAAPGFYVVELASPRLGAALFGTRKPYYVRTATLVTNLGVHFKLGRESSLVWVTRLADGKPVANAQVNVRDCRGRTYWQGKTDASGIARVDKSLPARQALPDCIKDGRQEYFVTARVGEDLAFAFSDWGEGISPWRFNVPTGNYAGPYVAQAVLDRSLVRAGETVSMKVFVRRQTGQGFALVPRQALADTLQVRHLGSDRKYSVPVSWQGAQHGEASFAVPPEALLGTYEILVRDTLAPGAREPQERRAGEFRVEAFRVPLLRARLQALATPLVKPADVAFDVQVSYLAGGGAAGLPVRLYTQTEPRTTRFADFEDVAFAAGNVREGREEQGESFAGFDGSLFTDPDTADDDTAPPARAARTTGRELAFDLDTAGGARATVKDIAADAGSNDVPRDLVAELEYRDPNGETLTAATRVPLWPSRVLLGIKPDSWAASKERLKFAVIAVDVTGATLPGVRVKVDAFKREYTSHRRRLIGGFYAYEHGSETTRVGGERDLCAGVTDRTGILACDVAPPASGNLILRAQAADRDGNAAVTRADAWVATGDEEWSFAASDNDRIDLLPERKRYEPGETARFQVRTPFKEATALITVEREGVLESFVRTVRRDEPVLEIPIKGGYAPNVFVSALLVRGRIGGIAPTAMIDLAKPAWRMGLAEIRVGWAEHELAVKVAPEKSAYPVRGKAKVEISVRRADGSAPGKGAEIALAAIDEGLLELLPNNSWKLLDAMMARRGEEVETATAQMQVIGRRHFGRKAVPAGGGGGRQSARELFDTLLLWKARVLLDDAGNATVEVPLNDSLTAFRIVAVASSGAGLFGTGQASIHATQDLMLVAGLPPLVRDGDRFRAGFTVRNASLLPQNVTVSAHATAGAGRTIGPLAAHEVALAPGEARDLDWDVTAPANASRLDWQVEATARVDGSAEPVRDALKVAQKVIATVPERTYQATIFQLDATRNVAVERPADALPNRGGISMRLQEKLGGDLPGVREYLEAYPFTCFEQRASAAVGLADRRRWDALMAALPGYLDRDGLVKFFPVLRDGDDTLTAYVLALADEAGWTIPDESRNRMAAALRGFVEGRIVRHSPLPTADLTLRKVAAMAALARGKEPVPPAWLDTMAIEPNLWPTSAVIDWYLLLSRQPALPKRAERLAETGQILRSRLNFQGTTMRFSTEKTDALWWLMVSADANANRLLLAMEGDPAWREDIPRLVTGTLGRMQRGRWNTTVANAWGVLALAKFAQRFEAGGVTGTTSSVLGSERFDHTWKGSDGTTQFAKKLAWPAARADLALSHAGTGRPWVTLSSLAAIPLTSALSSGYDITRTVAPVQQRIPGRWSRGDVARVRLAVNAASDMTWVVVSDPIPAGSTLLGRGLGGDSSLQAAGERRLGAVWPTFEERTFEGFRAYYRYVPKGGFVVEYTVRLNNPGAFHLPPARVEAMYAPEMFGELPNADWVVQP